MTDQAANGPDRPGPGDRPDLYRVFVPRRARSVAYTVGAAQFVLLTAIAVTMPGSGAFAFTLFDRTMMIATAVLVALVLWRFGQVPARPDATHLVVRNLTRTTRLAWPQIVAVQFGDAPWVNLDLADGENLAVMAVQRADGAAGRKEARRLATLVALNSRTDRND